MISVKIFFFILQEMENKIVTYYYCHSQSSIEVDFKPNTL